MKTKFYYLRDPINSHPLVTVCLAMENKNIARGVSICSLQDLPNQHTGRMKAMGRAVSALKRGSGLPIIREEAWDVLDIVGQMFMDKRSLNPRLRPLEEKILGTQNA